MRWRSVSILTMVSLGLVGMLIVIYAISFGNPFYIARSAERTETRLLLLSGRMYWISAEQAGFVVESSLTLDDFDAAGLTKYEQTYLSSDGKPALPPMDNFVPPRTNALGFARLHGKDDGGRSFSVSIIPFWPGLLLLAPCFWWFSERRERQRRFDQLLCLNCGYDIRESCKQCPKCGWIMPYELSLQLALKHSARDQARDHAENPNPRHLDPLILQMQPPEIHPHRGNGKAAR